MSTRKGAKEARRLTPAVLATGRLIRTPNCFIVMGEKGRTLIVERKGSLTATVRHHFAALQMDAAVPIIFYLATSDQGKNDSSPHILTFFFFLNKFHFLLIIYF